MKPKFGVDFNEIIGDNLLLLSQQDVRKDVEGKDILLTEGLMIDVFEPDLDDNGNRDDLIASGYVTRCHDSLHKHVKWCCKIDSNWIRHMSDDNASI